MNSNHHHGHRARLRKRFASAGLSAFSDHEKIEFLLTYFIPRKDTKPIAKSLLTHFGSIKAILDAPLHELQAMEGLGPIAASAFPLLRDFCDLYLLEEAQNLPLLDSSDKLENFWVHRLHNLKNEVFEVALLDNQYRLLSPGVHRLEEGTHNYAVVYPRKILELALKHSASSLVLAHNHPSGIAQPSEHDVHLTHELKKTSKVLELEIIDHLIVAKKEVFSFRRMKLL